MENSQRRPRHGSIESNPGQFESLNVTALGSYYPSMSTIAYNVPSVAYQVRDIQNRKLPDPPSPTLLSEVEQELYENTNLTYLTPTASTTSHRGANRAHGQQDPNTQRKTEQLNRSKPNRTARQQKQASY